VADRGEDHEADKHPEAAKDHRLASTKVLHDVQTAKSASEVDCAEDDCCNVAVADSRGGEDGGSVVKEEVGTWKSLLERVGTCHVDSTLPVSCWNICSVTPRRTR